MFDIQRIIRYKNSSLPKIIERDFNGIAIKVKMRLHISVIVFLCIWCGLVGFACVTVLTQSFNSSEFISVILLPLGILFLVYLRTMGFFKYESNKSKKDLQTLFEADIIES